MATFLARNATKIKWALIYGVILSNARAMGEFGAVSVVSGHIRGLTNTIPLYVEISYNEYQFVAAFACASLLALIAVGTLGLQNVVRYVERKKSKNNNGNTIHDNQNPATKQTLWTVSCVERYQSQLSGKSANRLAWA